MLISKAQYIIIFIPSTLVSLYIQMIMLMHILYDHIKETAHITSECNCKLAKYRKIVVWINEHPGPISLPLSPLVRTSSIVTP